MVNKMMVPILGFYNSSLLKRKFRPRNWPKNEMENTTDREQRCEWLDSHDYISLIKKLRLPWKEHTILNPNQKINIPNVADDNSILSKEMQRVRKIWRIHRLWNLIWQIRWELIKQQIAWDEMNRILLTLQILK